MMVVFPFITEEYVLEYIENHPEQISLYVQWHIYAPE